MSPQSKTTPARQRSGPSQPRSGVLKAYASENDAAALDASRHHQQPQTPSKPPTSPAPADAVSAMSGSKRSRNKVKARDAHTSPDSMHRHRQTPPFRSVSAKPSTGTAFAGASFHASPAPSSLPLPSFHTKSSAGTPVQPTRDVVQEPSPPATDTDPPTPFRPVSMSKAHESPLDFIFRAHREEKERLCHVGVAQKGSASNAASPQPGVQTDACRSPSFSTISQSRRINTAQATNGFDPSSHHSPGLKMGPAFSTPYQERIQAARSSASLPHAYHSHEEQSHASTLQTDDPTVALKRFLFGTNSTASRAASAPIAPEPDNHVSSGTDGAQNSSAESGREGSSQSHIQAMETDLRRILKLNLTPNTS